MKERIEKLVLLKEFNQVCQQTLASDQTLGQFHRKRLEKYRPKLQKLLKDPDFGELAANFMKVLNVVLHYVKTGDEEQLLQSTKIRTAATNELLRQLKKY